MYNHSLYCLDTEDGQFNNIQQNEMGKTITVKPILLVKVLIPPRLLARSSGSFIRTQSYTFPTSIYYQLSHDSGSQGGDHHVPGPPFTTLGEGLRTEEKRVEPVQVFPGNLPSARRSCQADPQDVGQRD